MRHVSACDQLIGIVAGYLAEYATLSRAAA
jgi:hypothetical protein